MFAAMKINILNNFQIWDAKTGGEVQSFQHKHIVKSVNFSRDNIFLATGSNEKLLRIFDLNKPSGQYSIQKGNMF